MTDAEQVEQKIAETMDELKCTREGAVLVLRDQALDNLEYVRQCIEREAEGFPLPDDALSCLCDVMDWTRGQ